MQTMNLKILSKDPSLLWIRQNEQVETGGPSADIQINDIDVLPIIKTKHAENLWLPRINIKGI